KDEGPPDRSAAPEEKSRRIGAQAVQAPESQNQKDAGDAGRPCGEEVERVTAADLAERFGGLYWKVDVTADHAPGDAVSQQSERQKRTGRQSWLRDVR